MVEDSEGLSVSCKSSCCSFCFFKYSCCWILLDAQVDVCSTNSSGVLVGDLDVVLKVQLALKWDFFKSSDWI